MSWEILPKYQTILLELSEVSIRTFNIQNPASFLPSELMNEHTFELVIVNLCKHTRAVDQTTQQT
jgi:hypothetical protein